MRLSNFYLMFAKLYRHATSSIIKAPIPPPEVFKKCKGSEASPFSLPFHVSTPQEEKEEEERHRIARSGSEPLRLNHLRRVRKMPSKLHHRDPHSQNPRHLGLLGVVLQ